MKNFEVVNGIIAINKFVDDETTNNGNYLTRSGKFKLRRTLHMLLDIYKTYEECLNEINDKYVLTEEVNEDNVNEIRELLDVENDIEVIKLTEEDFTDECSMNSIMLLDFMID